MSPRPVTRQAPSTRRRTAREVGSPIHRARVLLVAMAAAIMILSGWLVRVQALDPGDVAQKARNNRTRTETIAAARGNIYDAQGQPLATSVERYTITGSPDAVRKYKDASGAEVGAAGAAKALAPILNLPEADLLARLTDLGNRPDRPSQYTRLAKDVTPQVWRQVEALKIPGVHKEAVLRRAYPAGSLAGNVIGFLGKDSDATPLAGLEREFNSTLSGKNGTSIYEHGLGGQRIPSATLVNTEPIPGSDIYTTLHRDIQWYAQDVIANTVRNAHAQWGSVIVQNPHTGEIVALAEYPAVDPNDPQASHVDDRGNRSLSDVIEPGSTAKVITTSMAIEEKLAEPTSRLEIDDTYVTPNGEKFHDSHDHAREKVTLAGILAQSSNTGTVMIAEKAPREKRYEYLKRFGVGEPTGLGFPGESRGLLAPPEKWDGRQQYTVMFGQGMAMTPMQSTMVFSAIANDGMMMKPRLVTKVESPKDGEVNDDARLIQTETRQVVSPETARQVRTMLESVVSDGTGENASVPGYRVAGKTGTAQAPKVGGSGYDGYTASFIGMAPAENPQLVVSVVVQRPVGDYFGGTIAAPAFRKVMGYALTNLRVPPSTEPSQPYPLDWK